MTEDVFEDLVNLYLDKEITSVQLHILRRELERNPRRRKIFRSYCRLHQATHIAALSQCPVIPTLGKSMARRSHFLGHFYRKPAWVGAFVILVLTSTLALYLNGPVVAPIEKEAIAGSVNQSDWFQVEAETLSLPASLDVETIAGSVSRLDWFDAEADPSSRAASPDAFRTFQAQGQPLQNWDYTQSLRPLRVNPEYLPSQRPEEFPFSSGYSGFLADQEVGSGFDFGYPNYEFKR